ncbi:Signal transduction histidine kinase, contains PAS domain [Natrarchaeobaculum sulfurireducens]|uniref:histidine kinase n=1 Tax=Natrarchaeobaculum sulfurireducens TaxID=2044521 RepID=A0A346PJ74_9EURY|nr:Signal transduction histidine kinase, contains PAS domain [Natrarchaeobaculum sulfurireducens]
MLYYPFENDDDSSMVCVNGSTNSNESDTLEETVTAVADPRRFDHLIGHLHDAVVEFVIDDGEPIVTDVNPAFVDLFGYDRADVVGKPLNECVVPSWLEAEATALDERTVAGKVNYRRVRRETADGLREFLYRGIPYETDDGNCRGFAVYTDLTEARRNQSRVDVLNRVLRHNLRNKVTLVAGCVEGLLEELEDDADPTVEQLSETARKSVDELRALAREAGELQRIADASVPDDPHVDAVPLARSVAGQLGRHYPGGTITIDLPETLEVAATDRLEVALESLLENAIVHNPSDDPRVRIEGGYDCEKWAFLAVADDGPGIPPVEREVITGESEITELRHGSGLGLWLVKWTVETFGGEIVFDTSRAGGSRVTIRLQRWNGEA